MDRSTHQQHQDKQHCRSGKPLEMTLEPSLLPISGLSRTSECVNRWCWLMIDFLKEKYNEQKPLTFYLWPYRSPAQGLVSIQNLAVIVDDYNPDRTTQIVFTVAHTFSDELYIDRHNSNRIQCLVPDYAEAIHIAGILANRFDASIKMFGQDTDQNPLEEMEIVHGTTPDTGVPRKVS